MARGHYEPYGASANRDPEFMQPQNSSSLASIAADTDRGRRRSVAAPRERGRESYDKTGKGLCEMAERGEGKGGTATAMM